jgi:hypothetical protein
MEGFKLMGRKKHCKYGIFLRSRTKPFMVYDSKQQAERVCNKHPLWKVKEVYENN